MDRGVSRRQRRHPYRGLIHLLNQRYHREWVRAEGLRQELDAMRRSRLWRAVGWLRTLMNWFSLPKPPAEPPLAERAAPYVPPSPDSPAAGLVGIVIPFRDQPGLLLNCLRGLAASTYRRFEVVLVDNGSTDPRTLRLLGRLRGKRRFRVVDAAGEFNFSKLCNTGARAAAGDHLLFLNNDTEVLSRDWLERLLAVAADPRVGVVGATLFYPDRTIQHAGLFPRTEGRWVHAYRGRPADDPGDGGELRISRCVPAVTAACLLVGRELFDDVGGFDERLPLTHNDVDLCARVRGRGRLVVVTPHARLFHYEGLTRGFSPDDVPRRSPG
jgi:GT2 family glycosyltransferase